MTTAAPNDWRGGSDATRLAAACVAAVTACIVLVALGSDAYETVLGIARPVAPVAAAAGLGFLGWMLVSRRSWIPAGTGGLAGYRPALVIGLALPIPAIIVDGLGGFARELNAPAPDSFLFYPSVAVVAELVFHVAPLAIAAMLATVFHRAGRAFQFLGFGAAVAIEPVLQVVWGRELSPGWANAYVGVHVLAFNVVGVYLLRRFGILRVILYRLSYYLVWHVLWGYLRLDLIFGK
jgi:hypothetical protein